MKVLMFGWKFPPLNSGGLGTACYGLTKGLSNNGVEVTFVLPMAADIKSNFAKIISADSKIGIKSIDSPLSAYMTSEGYELIMKTNPNMSKLYGKDLFKEVYRYSKKAIKIAASEPHDVIHAHDWMTFQAGIQAKRTSGKPLVIHVHATEFDRTGGNGVNPVVYNLEKEGMYAADSIIAVSNFTKNKIIEHYGISPDKIHVVHNAVEIDNSYTKKEGFGLSKKNKIVLFLGRITLQKGPDYFIYAAKRALEIMPDIRFIIAGSGDMEPHIMEKAAELGIADKVLFAGFLSGSRIDEAYRMADLYIMPSVSEPFGLTPLEAMKNSTPVIISKQSGVSEVINHCLKVDFWDIDKMVNQMISILKHAELSDELRKNAILDIQKLSWDDSARKCIDVYSQVINNAWV